MKTKLIILSIFLILGLSTSKVEAQSTVTEIAWVSNYVEYRGLLVIFSDNRGVFKAKYFINGQLYWVEQDAQLRNQFDYAGNCTSYINCTYPRTRPRSSYSADNFIIYPNGAMYTQDAAGNWSTMIKAMMIAPQYWQRKFNEYGID